MSHTTVHVSICAWTCAPGACYDNHKYNRTLFIYVSAISEQTQTREGNNNITSMHILSASSPDAPNQGRPEYRTTSHFVPENGTSAPTLESLLQVRLRKIASDNEDE